MNERVRRWVVLLAAVAGAVVTARLGLWQLDRAAQKQALHRALVERGAMPPLSTTELARDEAAAPAQHHRRVILRGQWLPQHTLYLDNRQMNGRPGFFVLTPLQLAPGDAVLVQRGWIPRDAAQRDRLAPVSTPGGTVEVPGRIAPPPSRLYEFAEAASGPIRQNVELAALARDSGLALRPLSVLQTGGPTEGLRRDWPQPAIDVSKHHGYAFQWFALSALITGLYVWFQLLRPRRRAAAA